MNHPVVHQVYQGNMLAVQNHAPGWLYVKLPSGQFGWVVAKFTTQIPPLANGW